MPKILALSLALYLSLGSLFPRTDFSQFYRVINTLQHFQTHQAEAAQTGDALSFWSFLYMHFVEIASHDHPGEDHHQELPFQQINLGMQLLCPQVWLPQSAPETPLSPAPDSGEWWVPIELVTSIFHPPSC